MFGNWEADQYSRLCRLILLVCDQSNNLKSIMESSFKLELKMHCEELLTKDLVVKLI